MHSVEFARLPSALAECGQDLQRLPVENMDAVVFAIGQIDVLLLRILRESDVPRRAGTQGFFIDEPFLDESPVRFED
jgi:hypothetical protein